MQADDRKPFKTLLGDVMAFYRQDISRFALDVWWQACEPFDFEQVTKAFSAHALDPERGQFPPRPADLVRVLSGTQTDRSLIAWGKAYAAMQRVGAYASVCFDDGVIHAVVEDLGGWVKLCRSSTDELPHLQRRFCEAYRAYVRRPDLAFPPRLAGEHEQHNALAGRRVAAPVLIGQPELARQVHALGRMERMRITHVAEVATLPPVAALVPAGLLRAA